MDLFEGEKLHNILPPAKCMQSRWLDWGLFSLMNCLSLSNVWNRWISMQTVSYSLERRRIFVIDNSATKNLIRSSRYSAGTDSSQSAIRSSNVKNRPNMIWNSRFRIARTCSLNSRLPSRGYSKRLRPRSNPRIFIALVRHKEISNMHLKHIWESDEIQYSSWTHCNCLRAHWVFQTHRDEFWIQSTCERRRNYLRVQYSSQTHSDEFMDWMKMWNDAQIVVRVHSSSLVVPCTISITYTSRWGMNAICMSNTRPLVKHNEISNMHLKHIWESDEIQYSSW
jgi:hypothetical protein